MCNKCMCLTSNSYFCVFAAKPKSLLQAETSRKRVLASLIPSS